MVRNFVERVLSGLMYDAPGDDGGGNEKPVGDGAPGGDNNPDHKPGAGDGKPNKEGQPGAGGRREPVDDSRLRGVLADLKKEREARQKLERDHGVTAAELERERKRVLALSGVEPKSKEDEDEALIRERLERMYPWMKGMTEEKLKSLESMGASVDEIRNATTNTWRAHGQKMLDSLEEGASKVLGGKLSERQKTRIQTAYVEEARSNPEFLRRHEAGDPKLVSEFIKDWMDDFVEPGRRSALQEEVQRRPRVPSGKDRSIVGADNKPIDVKDDKAVADFLAAGFKQRGGQFGRHR